MAAVLVAAGSGLRLGRSVPKAYVELGGRPLVAHALERLVNVRGIAAIAVVVPPGSLGEARRVIELAMRAGTITVTVHEGGPDRADSVRAGLAAVPPGIGCVLVHDAARPLAPTALADRVAESVLGGASAAIPALPVSDTIKEVSSQGTVVRTLDRSSLVAVQTPQGFAPDALIAAHARAQHARVTDDAAVMEAAGHNVRVVPGDPLAHKITTAHDLALAELLVRGLPIREPAPETP